MKCPKCGAENSDDALFCYNCGYKFEGNAQNIASTVTMGNQQTTAQQNNSGIKLSEGETVVRTYLCSASDYPQTQGFLIITNKRLFFQGLANKSRVVQEVALDSVSGLTCYYGRNLKVWKIVLGIILIIASYFSFKDRRTGLGIVLLIIGVLLFLFLFRKTFLLKVYSSKANGSPISVGEGPVTSTGNESLFAIQAEPTAVTDQMMDELGAMVVDLQTLGDAAIEKWKE